MDKKRNKITDLAPAVLFFAFFICLMLLSFTDADLDASISESRSLTVWKNVEEAGDPEALCDTLSAYLSDQFPFREDLLAFFSSVQVASGVRNVRDVVILSQDRENDPADQDEYARLRELLVESFTLDSNYLFIQANPVPESYHQQLFTEIKMLGDELGVPQVYAAVPQKNLGLADGTGGQLSIETDLDNMAGLLSAAESCGVTVADICSRFLEDFDIIERSSMYYKIDFHWNLKGAYYASKLLGEELVKLGFLKEDQLPENSAFSWKDFGEDRTFISGFKDRFSSDTFDPKEANIPYYRLDDSESCRYFTSLEGGERERDKVIAAGIEKEELDYPALSTVNYPYLRVENPKASSPLKVLIYKDSYECPMTEYLSAMFAECNIVDPRFEAPTAAEIKEKRGIDLVLYLFHQNNNGSDMLQFLKTH